jgi:acetyltransferase-like isoleucine patch superfamily enzyme
MISLKSTQILNLDESRMICRNIQVGRGTTIWEYVNLYECKIGEDCMIGAFVEIQKSVVIGNRTRIQSHTFICEKVRIGNDCFISHGVTFINDNFKSGGPAGNRELWKQTEIKDHVSIGSNATIMPVTIGRGAVIGAGAVVVRDVPPWAVVVGNPARVLRNIDENE